MTYLHRIALVGATALPLALGGCAVAVVGGMAAAGGVGYEATQERGLQGSVQDIALKTEIETALLQSDPALPIPVAVTVSDGRVLLTGRVPTPDMKAQAGRVVSQHPGVRAVYDEIEVSPASGTMASAEDAVITARLRSQLILDPDIRSANFTIDTADRAVYLMGQARSQAEIDRATQIARYIPGVRRVVSYMDIRVGVPVAAQTAPSSVGVGAPPASAAPSAPIQREKL
jgi:osmotically-inducible protein OsmY